MHPCYIKKTDKGIYCAKGQFFVDPWKHVPIALITHAHGDHAYFGSDLYYCSENCFNVLQHRLGPGASIIAKPYGEKFKLGDAWVSFHPAGHILGSSQIRIELKGCVTVISGDYKREIDPTCTPFEVIECDEFLTESTFALPIYHWPNPNQVIEDIISWYRDNKNSGHSSILFCYSLGKAQRIQALLKDKLENPILVHGAIASMNEVYEKNGVQLAQWKRVQESDADKFTSSLILAPPSALGSTWLRKFNPSKTALASGWMTVRGTRRRRGYDTGFVISDHADWPSLIKTVQQTKAKKIWITHGIEDTLARYIEETFSIKASPFHLSAWGQEEED